MNFSQASLVGHIEESGLLQDDRCYIEFGAGKGMQYHETNLLTQCIMEKSSAFLNCTVLSLIEAQCAKAMV